MLGLVHTSDIEQELKEGVKFPTLNVRSLEDRFMWEPSLLSISSAVLQPLLLTAPQIIS